MNWFSGPQVLVWRIDLRDADGCGPEAFAGLDPTEQGRGDRLLDPALARRWKYAHVAMRHILAAHLGLLPEAVVYVQAGGGKPRLAPGLPADLDFSLSHSGDWAWLAVTHGCVLGIDLERMTPDLNWRGVLPLVASKSEARLVMGSPESLQCAQFHRLWVRKEAVLKAVGVGLCGTRPLQEIEILDACCGMEVGSGGGSETWWLMDLPAPPGYGAALATSEARVELVWYDYALLV